VTCGTPLPEDAKGLLPFQAYQLDVEITDPAGKLDEVAVVSLKNAQILAVLGKRYQGDGSRLKLQGIFYPKLEEPTLILFAQLDEKKRRLNPADWENLRQSFLKEMETSEEDVHLAALNCIQRLGFLHPIGVMRFGLEATEVQVERDQELYLKTRNRPLQPVLEIDTSPAINQGNATVPVTVRSALSIVDAAEPWEKDLGFLSYFPSGAAALAKVISPVVEGKAPRTVDERQYQLYKGMATLQVRGAIVQEHYTFFVEWFDPANPWKEVARSNIGRYAFTSYNVSLADVFQVAEAKLRAGEALDSAALSSKAVPETKAADCCPGGT